MTTATEDDTWLIHLKAACDAGYYKAGSAERIPAPPDKATCRDCFCWLNGFCRLASRQCDPDADICAFFIALPTPQTMEHQSNEIPGTPTGERA